MSSCTWFNPRPLPVSKSPTSLCLQGALQCKLLLPCSLCSASSGSQALRSAQHFPLLGCPLLGLSLLPDCLAHIQHSGLVRPKWQPQGTLFFLRWEAKTSCRTLASTAWPLCLLHEGCSELISHLSRSSQRTGPCAAFPVPGSWHKAGDKPVCTSVRCLLED